MFQRTKKKKKELKKKKQLDTQSQLQTEKPVAMGGSIFFVPRYLHVS